MKRRIFWLMVTTLSVMDCGLLVGEQTVIETPGPPPGTGQVAATVPVAVTLPPSEVPTAAYDPFAEERPLAQVTYVMPPAVQLVTETTAQIMFELAQGQPGVLFYRALGDAPGPLQDLPLDPSSTRHLLTLEGLTPATPYQFVVRLGEGEPETLQDVAFREALWGVQSFRTPPYGPPLRFTVIGDSGFNDPVTYSMGQQMADLDPDFMLHVGDIVYAPYNDPDAYAAWQLKYFAPFVPVLKRAPIYPAVGNHDVNELASQVAGVPLYYQVFPPVSDPQFPPSDFEGRRDWYAFAANGIQFISLNTQAFFGYLDNREQLAWFEERLADTRFDYNIVFFHVPPYSSGPQQGDGFAVRPTVSMMEEAGVPVVFCGHDHVYERLTAGSITYFVSGGGSSALYSMEEQSPYSQFFLTQNHFLLVEITSDLIQVRAIADDGSVIEEIAVPVP